MTTLSARLATEWRSFTPLHEQAIEHARRIAVGDGGPYAAAVVGVYGSGKSTLLFTILREAPGSGTVAIWDEAAPFIERILAGNERVLPQTFAARVLAFTSAVVTDAAARARYLSDLMGRGHREVALAVASAIERGHRRVILILDEVEQAHELLRKRIAADDGQPMRALIDACGPDLRLLLAYAPESYHAVGDADRGRLVYLSVPALDVASIQTSFELSRGEANFAWWASRGRARGVIQAVKSVVEPFRAGAFDRGLDDLGDALDALPGVFGVPAILRDGLSHAKMRALLDLRPADAETGEQGVVCTMRDRSGLADRIRADLVRHVGAGVDLGPVANEVVSILEAVGDEEDRAYLTLDDFRAVLRTAEARAIESGRQAEPIERLVDRAILAFPSLGEMCALTRRLPLPLTKLAEDCFPSPFTDPYLPLTSGRTPSDAELDRRFKDLAATPEPLMRSEDPAFMVVADEGALAAWMDGDALDGAVDPTRALILDGASPRPPIVQLAALAGRLCVREVGPFHATFLKCLALRAAAQGARSIEAVTADLSTDRQLGRKVRWHLGRIALLLSEVKAKAEPRWAAATRFVRDEQFRGALGRLKADSPALLALLAPLAPPSPSERRMLSRIAKLLDRGAPLRRVASMVNPGGRLSGAAVVVDELLPSHSATPRWTERPAEGARDLAELLDTFGTSPPLRARIARWIFPEDPARLEALFAFHAGVLPDVSKEHEQLGALQGLERTSQRVEGILSDLETCTGKTRDSLRGLRLGAVTDQIRGHRAAIDQLEALGAEARAEAVGGRAWVRSLALWICGVFADRLLQGVEKEQSEISEWETLAARARDVGAHATEIERDLRAVGATTCADALRVGRARMVNHLGGRSSLEQELGKLSAGVTEVQLLAAALRSFADAMKERGISLADAIAAYLPDEDAISSHQNTLRRCSDLLDEIEGPCPPPGNRDLLAYVELLRRHAEATRRERLRMRLEGALDVTLSDEVRLDVEAVSAIERAWPDLPAGLRDFLRAEIEARTIETSDDIERWIDQARHKAAVVSDWMANVSPAILELDERSRDWTRRLDVTTQQVRDVDRERSRVLRLIAALPALLRPSAVETLVRDGAAGDTETAYTRAGDAVDRFSAALDAALGQLRQAGIAEPHELPVDTAAAAIEAVSQRVAAAILERDSALDQVREIDALVTRWGERPPAIPAELNLRQAKALLARETDRLRVLLRRKRETLATWLAALGLPEDLVPAEADDVIEWSARLVRAEEERARLEPITREMQQLGIACPALDRADWAAVHDAVTEHAGRAREERRGLARRWDEAADRARRLGGSPSSNAVETLTVTLARAAVQDLEREVERLRAARLSQCTPDARAAYAAIGSGDPTSLAGPIAELVRLGLLRTLEDPR